MDDDDDGEEMTTLELVAATALFGWECPPAWKRISRIAHAIAVDPFFDLFAMSCIVANTVLMALDHSDIDRQMELALVTGNYVCINYLRIYSQATVNSFS